MCPPPLYGWGLGRDQNCQNPKSINVCVPGYKQNKIKKNKWDYDRWMYTGFDKRHAINLFKVFHMSTRNYVCVMR